MARLFGLFGGGSKDPQPRVWPRAWYPAGSTAGRGHPRIWPTFRSGPNRALLAQLGTLQARSQRAHRIYGYARRGVNVLVDNCISTGILPMSKCPDAAVSKALNDAFGDWLKEADADGMNDWAGWQAKMLRGMIINGESFARRRFRRAADGLVVPIQFQYLPSEICPADKTDGGAGRNEVVAGIEFDPIGQRAAYHMFQRHPFDQTGAQVANVETRPVPASEIRHLYDPQDGLIRGEPWLVRALVKLEDMDAYDDAELVRKKNAAQISGFIKRPASSPGDQLLGEETIETSADGAAETVVMSPGSFVELQQGEDVEMSQPGEVGGSYDTFMRWQLRNIAVSIGILYEQLTADYSTLGNDRIYRHAMSEFKRSCTVLQWLFVQQVLEWAWVSWVDAALLAGITVRPAGMTDRDLYRVVHNPPRWEYMHPVQDVQADAAAVAAGFTSRRRVVASRGDDVEQIDEERAEDMAREEKLGLTTEPAAGAAPEPEPDEPPPSRHPAEQ